MLQLQSSFLAPRLTISSVTLAANIAAWNQTNENGRHEGATTGQVQNTILADGEDTRADKRGDDAKDPAPERSGATCSA